jgi:hypothetical protein
MTPAPTANAPVTTAITFTDVGVGREVAPASSGPVDVGGAVTVAVGGAVTVPAGKLPDSPQVWVEAWVQPALPLTGEQTVLTKPGSYTLAQVDGNLKFEVIPVSTGAPCTALSAGAPMVAGAWQHVSGWYDGMSVTVALNGAVLGTVACPNGAITPTPSSPFHVGGIPGTSGVTAAYNGRIDELRVRQSPAQAYNLSPSPSVNGDLTFNQVVSRVMGPTTASYTGHITFTAGNGRRYYGRAATTAICQAQYGAGARMCSLTDLQRMMEANAIKPVSPDSPADVPATASSLPTVHTWVNAGAFRAYWGAGATNVYGDCFNWSGPSVANGSYGGLIYIAPSASWPFGYTENDNCNLAHPLMCCK